MMSVPAGFCVSVFHRVHQLRWACWSQIYQRRFVFWDRLKSQQWSHHWRLRNSQLDDPLEFCQEMCWEAFILDEYICPSALYFLSQAAPAFPWWLAHPEMWEVWLWDILLIVKYFFDWPYCLECVLVCPWIWGTIYYKSRIWLNDITLQSTLTWSFCCFGRVTIT